MQHTAHPYTREQFNEVRKRRAAMVHGAVQASLERASTTRPFERKRIAVLNVLDLKSTTTAAANKVGRDFISATFPDLDFTYNAVHSASAVQVQPGRVCHLREAFTSTPHQPFMTTLLMHVMALLHDASLHAVLLLGHAYGGFIATLLAEQLSHENAVDLKKLHLLTTGSLYTTRLPTLATAAQYVFWDDNGALQCLPDRHMRGDERRDTALWIAPSVETDLVLAFVDSVYPEVAVAMQPATPVIDGATRIAFMDAEASIVRNSVTLSKTTKTGKDAYPFLQLLASLILSLGIASHDTRFIVQELQKRNAEKEASVRLAAAASSARDKRAQEALRHPELSTPAGAVSKAQRAEATRAKQAAHAAKVLEITTRKAQQAAVEQQARHAEQVEQNARDREAYMAAREIQATRDKLLRGEARARAKLETLAAAEQFAEQQRLSTQQAEKDARHLQSRLERERKAREYFQSMSPEHREAIKRSKEARNELDRKHYEEDQARYYGEKVPRKIEKGVRFYIDMYCDKKSSKFYPAWEQSCLKAREKARMTIQSHAGPGDD